MPFEYVLRDIALSWQVPPPFMQDWFSYEDIERELQYRQILAQAQRSHGARGR